MISTNLKNVLIALITGLVINLAVSQGSLYANDSEATAVRLVKAHFRAKDLVTSVERLASVTDHLGESEALRDADTRFARNLGDISGVAEKALSTLDNHGVLTRSDLTVRTHQAALLSLVAAVKLRLKQLDLLSQEDREFLDELGINVRNIIESP